VESAESLAAGVRDVLARGAEGRRELGERGLAAVERRFTLEHMIDGLLAVYGELA
jgi:glycosyltransferase involved in cell wall biosynthesis